MQHTTRRNRCCHLWLGRAALVQLRACCSYSFRLLMYCFATTASCGSSGSGHCNNSCRLSRAVLMPSAGDHSSLRMSRQIAPVWLDIFGCQTCRPSRVLQRCGQHSSSQTYYTQLPLTFVMNLIFGGVYGYCAFSSMSMRKVPPS